MPRDIATKNFNLPNLFISQTYGAGRIHVGFCRRFLVEYFSWWNKNTKMFLLFCLAMFV